MKNYSYFNYSCADIRVFHDDEGGSGQLFELSERHVIYRDLTVPEGLGNEPQRQNVTAPGIAP